MSLTTSPFTDPYLRPSTSRANRMGRALWGLVYVFLFRPSPRPLHAWRAGLLRLFGASLGSDCHIYPKARIWAPWNLVCADVVAIADEAVIYNPAPIHLGSHSVISQQAYLCAASHDYTDPGFPMISKSITVNAHAWICARACVQMGVVVGEGSVLALNAVATRDLAPWSIYAGAPARRVKARTLNSNDTNPIHAH